MTALATRLPELAAEINRELTLCEASYRTSMDHALRVGELLSEAKGQVSHGQWLPWLTEHTPVSERTAQRYMQLAANPTLVSGLGIKETLQSLATPAPAPAPPADLRAALRGVDKADAEAALAELGELPAQDRFPASAMQRTTWRQVREHLAKVSRAMEEASGDGLSDWSRREALQQASRQARNASELLSELAGTLAV